MSDIQKKQPTCSVCGQVGVNKRTAGTPAHPCNLTTARSTQVKTKAARKPTERQMKIDKLFEPDNDGCSRWVSREEVENTDLKPPGRNGNGRYDTYFEDYRYVWEAQKIKKTNMAWRMVGFAYAQGSRDVRADIKNHFKGKPCVACNQTKKNMVVDHKNDLLNDPRVLDPKTQRTDEFQSLCQRCNLSKREVCKKMRNTGKRQGATQINGELALLSVDFISGDETYDPDDVNATVGTYWHDPIAFRTRALEIRDEKRDRQRADVDPELFRLFETMTLD